MEGYLKKYLNVFRGYKLRYFILYEDTLVYSEEKGKKIIGQMHLKVCSIQQSKDDQLLILINSGTKELKIKAKDINEKVKWIQSLQQAQEQVINKHKNAMEVMQNDTQIGNEFKKYFKESRLENAIHQKIAEICSYQALLDQKCQQIQVQFTDPYLKPHVETLIDLTAKIKSKLNETYKELEYEAKQLYYLAKNIEKNHQNYTKKISNSNKNTNNNQDVLNHNQNNNKNNNDVIQFEDQLSEIDSLDLNNYESFIGDEDAYYHQEELNQSKILQNSNNKVISNITTNVIDQNKKYEDFLNILKEKCKIKYMIIGENKIFQEYKIKDEESRDVLPAKKDPNEKLNIFNLLKDAIGKDLTKFAVPVYLNEPLSMLQRLCEQFEYAELLEKAAKEQESYMRMAYVMGFGLSITASTIGRIKKPFNPLLGETYELVDQKKEFRFISEQVSHHPPISAAYAESQYYKYWASSNVKTKFWGKSMEIKPLGSTNVLLLKTNDHITYTKNKTSVNNIIIGKTYIDHFGEMIFINHTTNETGVLNLKERGWRDRGAFEVEGEIKDQFGNIKCKLVGRWDEKLSVVDINTNQETIVWKRNPLSPNSEDYYHFTDFTKQLNLMNYKILLQIPITDSRLRPDQKALEAQQLSFASSEKLRLEEKQRARRKEYAQIGKHHEPVWFKEELNQKTQENEYVYLGGYFEARQTGKWPKELLDIF